MPYVAVNSKLASETVLSIFSLVSTTVHLTSMIGVACCRVVKYTTMNGTACLFARVNVKLANVCGS